MREHYQLDTYSYDTIIDAFCAVPEGTTSLQLNRDAFVKDSSTDVTEALRVLPASVASINFTYNSLGRRSTAELVQIFSAIPSSVTSLELRRNGLGNKTGLELAEIFAAIPATVRSLDLRWNDFYGRTPAELTQAFAVIPEGVTVYLAHNRLFDTTIKSCVERDAVLVALRTKRASVMAEISCHLDLSNNGDDEIQHILPTLACLHKKPVKNHNIDVNIILIILSYLNDHNRSLKAIGKQFNCVFQMVRDRPSLNNTLAIGAPLPTSCEHDDETYPTAERNIGL